MDATETHLVFAVECPRGEGGEIVRMQSAGMYDAENKSMRCNKKNCKKWGKQLASGIVRARKTHMQIEKRNAESKCQNGNPNQTNKY